MINWVIGRVEINIALGGHTRGDRLIGRRHFVVEVITLSLGMSFSLYPKNFAAQDLHRIVRGREHCMHIHIYNHTHTERERVREMNGNWEWKETGRRRP